MAGLCLVLYTIVISRMDRQTNVIFGGVDGAYVSSDSVSFLDPNAVETPEPTEDIWPKIDLDNDEEHLYSIVNADNLLSSAFKLEEEQRGKIYGTRYQQFSLTGLDELNRMLQDMEKAGFTPWINSSYREYSYQAQLYNSTASQIAYNMGIDDYLDPEYQVAADEAAKKVMIPGSSEHQLGTAVDILDRQHSRLVYSDMDPEFFAWLDEHCAEYGFIKRYPTQKLLLTGWDEPWHYRYVGKEVAEFIMGHGLCYEEFYAHYVPGFEY